jgi:RNA polymerase subunit RPABC4/transcription elongation factor Spt4
MNGHTQCPACRSLSSHVTEGEFKASGFQAFGNRVCDACGTAWRPRCPRWAAIVSIVTGCVLLGAILAVAGGVLFSQPAPHSLSDAMSGKGLLLFGFFTVMGLWAFFYGVAVLLGRAGKMIILGKVLAAPTTWETSESGDSSLTDGVCVGCQRPVPPGSAYCPHCGLRQAS